MRRARGVAAVLAAAALVAGLATTAAAKPKSKAKPVKTNDGCTLVTPAKVEKAFGTPIKLERPSLPPVRTCYVSVGADPLAAPGGLFTAIFEYIKSEDSAPNAIEAVQRIVDPDVAGGVKVETLDGLGELAYLYPDDGAILVAADKKLAFRMIWAPASQVAPLTSHTRKNLVQLARDAVKRA